MKHDTKKPLREKEPACWSTTGFLFEIEICGQKMALAFTVLRIFAQKGVRTPRVEMYSFCVAPYKVLEPILSLSYIRPNVPRAYISCQKC